MYFHVYIYVSVLFRKKKREHGIGGHDKLPAMAKLGRRERTVRGFKT